jgi:hypothetical protein
MVPLARLDDLVDAQVRPPPTPILPEPDEDDEDEEDEEDEEARMARVVGKIVEDLRAEVVRRTEALATLPAAVVAALPPAPEPEPTVDWREATFALLAGKLVRRELVQLRKRQANPTAAVARLEAFYRRFVGDALAELRPWLGRLPAVEAAEAAAAQVITGWADEAMQMCVAALQQGGLGDVIRRWEIDRAREAELTRALMEAIDG